MSLGSGSVFVLHGVWTGQREGIEVICIVGSFVHTHNFIALVDIHSVLVSRKCDPPQVLPYSVRVFVH